MAIDASIPLQAQVGLPALATLPQAVAHLTPRGQENRKRALARDDRAAELDNLQIKQAQQKLIAVGKAQQASDMASDMLRTQTLLNNGDAEGARSFLLSRLDRLNTARREDPSITTVHTESILGAIDDGDFDSASALVQDEINGLAQVGLITPLKDAKGRQQGLQANAPVLLTNPETKEKRLMFPVFDKDSGQARLEPADIPEGFQISMETPEERRNAELLSNIEELTQELKKKGEADPQRAADIEAAKDAVAKADKLFEATEGIALNISNLKQARQAVLDGAGTGPIQRFWPSFTEASVRLDNIQGRLGLDVVGATTFGALSKGELDLSKQVALPTGLDGPELVDWVDRRIAAQEAKLDYLQRQAVFLSEKNADGKQNTRADWAKAEKAALDEALQAFGVTDDDIIETMRANNMTRSDVLTEIRRRYERGGA